MEPPDSSPQNQGLKDNFLDDLGRCFYTWYGKVESAVFSPLCSFFSEESGIPETWCKEKMAGSWYESSDYTRLVATLI